MSLTERQAEIGELYYRSETLRFGRFPLSIHRDQPDLPLSPWYMHYPKPGKPGSELLPRLYELIGEEFYIMCAALGIQPKRIAGYPKGAQPLAAEHAKHYPNQPDILLEFDKIEDPIRGTVFTGPEGLFIPGDELVMDEDHTSGGRNKRLLRPRILEAGLVMRHVMNVVDRQQGGAENLAQDGVALHSIFTADSILAFGLEAGLATQAQIDEVQEYRANNQL